MIEIRCFGPVECAVDGAVVWRPSGHTARFIAILATHGGRWLTVGQIAESLWAGEPTQTSNKAVANFVAEMRRRLGPSAVETGDSSYRLGAAVGVDVDRFRAAVRRGVAKLGDDPVAAVDDLTAALQLRRGAPFLDIDLPDLLPAIAELDELVLTAEDHLADALLRSGAHVAAVPMLRRLVEHDPPRERRCELLMEALAAGGRVTEALEAFVAFRRRMVEVTGFEPGEQLRRLERSLLQRGDSSAPASAPGESPDSPSGEWRSELDRRESAFDNAVREGRLNEAIEAVLTVEHFGRSVFSDERMLALIRRACVFADDPSVDADLRRRLHAEHVSRVALEHGPGDARAERSYAALDAPLDGAGPLARVATWRARLYLAASMHTDHHEVSAATQLEHDARHLGDDDAATMALAFRARRAVRCADRAAWLAAVADAGNRAASTGRPVDRWCSRVYEALAFELGGKPEDALDRAELAHRDGLAADLTDVDIGLGALVLSVRWQDCLDRPGALVEGRPGPWDAAPPSGVSMVTGLLHASFRGEVAADDRQLAVIVNMVAAMPSAVMRAPLLAICAQTVWNASATALAPVIDDALSGDDSRMVVAGLTPVACFGPTDRYRAMMHALMGAGDVAELLARADRAAEDLGAVRWRSRLLFDEMELRAEEPTDGSRSIEAQVRSAFRRGGYGHRSLSQRRVR